MSSQSIIDLERAQEEEDELIALAFFLYKFIYTLELFELNVEETLLVIDRAVAHHITLPDANLDDKLTRVAEKLMEYPPPEQQERRVRRMHVIGRLLRENPYTATTIDFDDLSSSDDNDYGIMSSDDSEDATPRQLGGKKRKNKTNRILPQLKPVTMKNKKYTYKINDPPSLRHKAIDEGIRYENKHMNKTKKQAAISKKGRFNILRIYRRNNNLKECKILTKDMEYMDKKYKLGKTSKICSKKKSKKSKKSKKKAKKKSKRKTMKKK